MNQHPDFATRVRAAGLDGWLLYDFRGLNPFPAQLLQLGHGILTRRWFLYVPAHGQPTLIHHRIEAAAWQQVLPDEASLGGILRPTNSWTRCCARRCEAHSRSRWNTARAAKSPTWAR